jgi:hypothetical protein
MSAGKGKDLNRLSGEALEDELYRRVSESERSDARHCLDLSRELGIPRRHIEAMVLRAANRDSWRIAGMEPPRAGATIWTYTGKARDHLGWRAAVVGSEGEMHPLTTEEVREEVHRMIDESRGADIDHGERKRPYPRSGDDSTPSKGGPESTEKWTPSDPLIVAQANPDEEIRRCAICKKPIPSEMRSDAECCSVKCRRLLHRKRKGDPILDEAIRMVTNPPPCEGCVKPLFGMRAGSKVHNDYCRHLAKRRKGESKGADIPTEQWTPSGPVSEEVAQ